MFSSYAPVISAEKAYHEQLPRRKYHWRLNQRRRWPNKILVMEKQYGGV
jgi:hypothetical protein